MILWILAIVFMGVVGLVGYYQGAIRAAFSMVGLLVAASVAKPLGHLIEPLVAMTGLKQPVVLSFVGPAIAFLIVLVIFKVVAMALHKKIETYYKYANSDTKRQLFERLNTRLGIAFGVVNGIIYFFILVVMVSVLGYFTTQVSGAASDGFVNKLTTSLAKDAQSTGMTKAVSPFVPAHEAYYDAVDVLGVVYQNPLLEKRLASYPVFVTLAERPEFKGLADDVQFQNFWLKNPRPSIGEVLDHPKVKPLVDNPDLFKDVMTMLGEDLKDLKVYIETGKSPKYDDERILGRWNFDYRESISLARRNKPNIGSAELRQLRRVLGATMANATLTATIDKKIILRTPSNTKSPTSGGSWKAQEPQGSGKYTLNISEGGKNYETQATAEGTRLILTREGYSMVFEK
jgi:uncharacterized membrane protein required for colicin V production